MDRKRRSASHDRDATTKRDDDGREAGTPRIESRALFGDAREVIIAHEEQEYRLRRTSSGKLILTK